VVGQSDQKLNDNSSYKEYPYQQVDSNQIEKDGFEWFFRNGLPQTLNDDVYIYNLDSVGRSGTHWTCFVLQFPTIFYYDPFGTGLNGYPPEELRQFGRNNGFKIIYANEWDNQHIKSQLCGYYALYVAHMLKKHLGNLTENKFDSLLTQAFDHHPTTNNVNKITKWSKNEGLL
jgi:hypothetical protein